MSETIDLATVPTVTSPSGLSLIGLNGSGEMKKILVKNLSSEILNTVLSPKALVGDANEILTPAIYVTNAQTQNVPHIAGLLICIKRAVHAVQIFISIYPGKMSTRYFDADLAAWSDWSEV